MGDEAQRFKNRLSVKKLGVGLAGLDGVNQKVPLAGSSKSLLINAIKTQGCVKLVVQGDMLVGSSVKTPGVTEWGPKLDVMAKLLTQGEPCYFVLFRSTSDCLIVTYVPDDAKPFFKMLYASSKESVKDAVMSFDAEMQLEELNVAEIEDLSFENYQKKSAAPKPYTEQEILRQEQEASETAGGYGVLARIIAMQNGQASTNRDVLSGDASAKPMALPGMAGPGGMMGAISSVRLKPINQQRLKKQSGTNNTGGSSPVKSNAATSKAPIVKEIKPDAKEVKPAVKEVKMTDLEVKSPPQIEVETKPKNEFLEGPWNDELEMEIEYDLTEESQASKKSDADAVLDFDDEAILAPTNAASKMPPADEKAMSQNGSQVLNKLAVKPKKPGLFERISRMFRSKKVPKLTLDEIRSLSDADGTHTIEELRSMKINGEYGDLDPALLENCLSSREFGSLFSMTKENFYNLKPKQQARIKKKLGL